MGFSSSLDVSVPPGPHVVVVCRQLPPGPSGSGGGSPKVPFSVLLFSLLRLKIWASDDDPLAPALTHRNL